MITTFAGSNFRGEATEPLTIPKAKEHLLSGLLPLALSHNFSKRILIVKHQHYYYYIITWLAYGLHQTSNNHKPHPLPLPVLQDDTFNLCCWRNFWGGQRSVLNFSSLSH